MQTIPVRTLASAAIAILTLTGIAAGPAHAAPQDALRLTIKDAAGAWSRDVTLQSSPKPVGTHPNAAKACESLAAVAGNPSALPGDPDAICTKEYLPVTATAFGTWRNRKINWTRTYPNSCEMNAATTPVFGF
jgi:hypothetical protein